METTAGTTKTMSITSRPVKGRVMEKSMVAVLCLVLITNLALGAVLYDYQGSGTPANWWTGAGSYTQGAIAGPPPAWNIDTTSGAYAYYLKSPAQSEWDDLLNQGWALTVNMQVLRDDNNAADPFASGMSISTGKLGFRLAFGLNAGGNTTVAVNGVSTTLTGNGYAEYVLLDADHDTKADLYVDGVLKQSNIAAWYAGTGSYFTWGDGTSGAGYDGSANYHQITLAGPVPEPAALGLLGLGGFLLLRRRASPAGR